ncbi:MAG: helix-turn-helix domain-containing protein [Candidatus Hydrogenedentes bacterium]|nr:helix-turn-helix domain-containing protein [Candidatus Hydrogenedentota bacterium]
MAGSRTGPKRTTAEREADLVLIQDWYVRGDSQRTIAQRLGGMRTYSVSHQTICRDIETILDRWRQVMVRNVDKLKAEELAKLNMIEREAWAEWERSRLDKERHEETSDEEGASTKRVVEGRLADPRYLEKVQWCINKRCEILGLNAPAKYEHTGKDGQPIQTETKNAQELCEVLKKYNEVITEISRGQSAAAKPV